MHKLREVDLSARAEAPGSLALNRDGPLLAYIRNEKEVALQNVASDKDLRRAPITTSAQSAFVCFAPDGQTVLTESLVGNERVLERWSTSNGNRLAQLTINDDQASRVMAFEPGGRSLAIAARGAHVVELRDAGTAQLVRTFGKSGAAENSGGQGDAALQQKLRELGLNQQGELNEAEEDVGDFSSTYHASEAVTFTLDGKWLLTKRGRTGQLSAVVWDTSTGTEVQEAAGGQLKEVGNPEQSPDGRFAIAPQYEGDTTKGFTKSFAPIFASSKDVDPLAQRTKVLDAHSGQKLYTLDVGRFSEAGRIPAAGFSLDRSRIAVSGYKNSYGVFTGSVEPEI